MMPDFFAYAVGTAVVTMLGIAVFFPLPGLIIVYAINRWNETFATSSPKRARPTKPTDS